MYIIIDTKPVIPKIIFSTRDQCIAEETLLSIQEEIIFEWFNICSQRHSNVDNKYLIHFAESYARDEMRNIHLLYVPEPA